MINISGHYREERKITGYCDNDVPLMVNCCGKQIFQTQDYFCNRKDGRLDYQIIYIHRGSGHFYINNEWTTLSAGNIVLYRPGIPQFYSYYANEKPEVYWIHFTGNQCEDILNTYDIKTCYIGERLYLKLLFQEIITELQLKKVSYQDIVLHNFYIILCSIHRSFSSLSKPFDNDFSFDRLLLELNSKYANKWSISSMANYCKLSESYFSHMFKERMGLSPMQYLNNQRMEKAKDFLLSNSMTISNIAHWWDSMIPYISAAFLKNIQEYLHKCITLILATSIHPNGFSAILQTADSYLLSIFEYLPIERLLTSLPSRA